MREKSPIWIGGRNPQNAAALALFAVHAAAWSLQHGTGYTAYCAFFDHQAALGQLWGIAFGLPWYAPWSAFVWQEQFGKVDAYGFIDQAIVQSQALFLLPQFIVIGFWLCFQKKLRSNANLHGSARWAEEKEIRRMGYLEGKGVYVGGWLKKKPKKKQYYLWHNGPEHIMVFAPTRSGKGVTLAQKAAQEVGGKVVVPIFTDEEREKGLTDFNDLHKSRGLDEVKRQVGLVLHKDVKQEKDRDKGREMSLGLSALT